MLFNSASFPVFLLLVLVSFHLCPKKHKALLLLVASYAFYSFWNWKFSFLLGLSTVVDYYCGLKLGDPNTRSKNRFVLLSLLTNLGILGFFKYFNFFAGSFTDLLGILGMQASHSTLDIILPVGISFYTFQTISYTLDISRGKQKPESNFIRFALYVSFFPQLVAGPIERARNLLPQLKRFNRITKDRVWQGLALVILGYIKKVILSDRIAPIADAAFQNWESLPSIFLWEGLIVFSLQIYFDFSGYTDIARGVAKWFGVDLRVNFRQPYLSENITEFWKRWHISLSSWLKEYLYIPLGGNRTSRAKTYRNLMITMLLGGLWHGASFTFIVWGFLHGLYLAVHKLWLSLAPRKNDTPSPLPIKVLKIAATYFLVLITWLAFRAPDLTVMWGYLVQMFAFTGGWNTSVMLYLAMLWLIYLLVDLPIYYTEDEYVLLRVPKVYRLSYVTLCIGLILIFGFTTTQARPFIYFQF